MIHGKLRAGSIWGAVIALAGCASPSGGVDSTTAQREDCENHTCASDTGTVDSIVSLPSDSEPDPANQVCAAEVIGTELAPVNLFLMIDRSGSMTENNKWNQATSALRTFLKDPETTGLRVALRFFSDDEPMVGCTMQACSVDACAQPLVDVGALARESGSMDSHESRLVDAIDRTFPRSGMGTPIYPALGGALQWASAHRSEHPQQKAVVVFVTDGEPNGCDQDMTDISGLAAAAYANFAVPTYAIGLEGSNEAQMDQIASAGQTGQGIFIGSSNNAERELLQALTAIRGQTMSCDFAVPSPSEGQVVDPSRINVTIAHGNEPVKLFGVGAIEDCADGEVAWYYDDPNTPTRIHLCPAACNLAGAMGTSINVEMGCVETRRNPGVVR